MFIGHYSAALAGKRAAPKVPLWALFVAAQLVDIAWGVFILTGLERARLVPGITAANPLDLEYMPFTHSLLAAGLWSLGGAFLVRRLWPEAGRTGAVVGGLVVASHWLLDFLTHRPDLGILGDSSKVGLGLWNFPIAAFLAEIGLLWIAAVLCAGAFPHSPEARRTLMRLCFGMSLVQIAISFGPLPGSLTGMVGGALAAYLALAWAAGRVEQRLAQGDR